MGKYIGHSVRTIRFTGVGSSHYGPCCICGKNMDDSAVVANHKINKHADGFFYLVESISSDHAHSACHLYEGARFVSKASLPRRGRLVEYPEFALRQDMAAIGMSDSSIEEEMQRITALVVN